MLEAGTVSLDACHIMVCLCRLGNKTFSYTLPIQPQRARSKLQNFSSPGIHNGSYSVEVPSVEFKLCQKALAELLPQSIRIQRDALADERYLEPVTADQLATYMRPADGLLAATSQVGDAVQPGSNVIAYLGLTSRTCLCYGDHNTKCIQNIGMVLQGLLVVVKAQHGTRQGIINVSLRHASVQLTELGMTGQQHHVVTDISHAFAVLSKPQHNLQWLRQNVVHPGTVIKCILRQQTSNV